MTRLPLIALITFSTTLACREATPPEPVPPPVMDRDVSALFQTDGLAYLLEPTSIGYRLRVQVRFTNHLADTVYFPNCRDAPPVYLEKLVDDAGVLALAPVTQSCLSAPIAVAPGERYEPLVWLEGASADRMKIEPRFRVAELAGVYRLVWPHMVHHYDTKLPGFGVPLGVEHQVSNRFVLTVGAP